MDVVNSNSSSVEGQKVDLNKFSSVFNLDEDIISKIIKCYTSGIDEKYILPISRRYVELLSQLSAGRVDSLSRYMTPSGSYNLKSDCLERILEALVNGADISEVAFNMMPYNKVDILCCFLEHNIKFNGMAMQSIDMLNALHSAHMLGHDVEFILTQGYSAPQIMLLLGSALSDDIMFTSITSAIPVRIMPMAVDCLLRGIAFDDIISSHSLLCYSDEILYELFLSKILGRFDKMMLLPNLSLEQLIRFRNL